MVSLSVSMHMQLVTGSLMRFSAFEQCVWLDADRCLCTHTSSVDASMQISATARRCRMLSRSKRRRCTSLTAGPPGKAAVGAPTANGGYIACKAKEFRGVGDLKTAAYARAEPGQAAEPLSAQRHACTSSDTV